MLTSGGPGVRRAVSNIRKIAIQGDDTVGNEKELLQFLKLQLEYRSYLYVFSYLRGKPRKLAVFRGRAESRQVSRVAGEASDDGESVKNGMSRRTGTLLYMSKISVESLLFSL